MPQCPSGWALSVSTGSGNEPAEAVHSAWQRQLEALNGKGGVVTILNTLQNLHGTWKRSPLTSIFDPHKAIGPLSMHSKRSPRPQLGDQFVPGFHLTLGTMLLSNSGTQIYTTSTRTHTAVYHLLDHLLIIALLSVRFCQLSFAGHLSHSLLRLHIWHSKETKQTRKKPTKSNQQQTNVRHATFPLLAKSEAWAAHELIQKLPAGQEPGQDLWVLTHGTNVSRKRIRTRARLSKGDSVNAGFRFSGVYGFRAFAKWWRIF